MNDYIFSLFTLCLDELSSAVRRYVVYLIQFYIRFREFFPQTGATSSVIQSLENTTQGLDEFHLLSAVETGHCH